MGEIMDAPAFLGDEMGHEALPFNGGFAQTGLEEATERMNCRQIKSAKDF